MKLTQKQKNFIEFYLQTFNATESARRAGYKCKNDATYRAIGAENLAKLSEFIEPRIKEVDDNKIAKTEEIKRFWTSTMRNVDMLMMHRIKASELLAKANGLFIEKVEVNTSLQGVVLIDAE